MLQNYKILADCSFNSTVFIAHSSNCKQFKIQTFEIYIQYLLNLQWNDWFNNRRIRCTLTSCICNIEHWTCNIEFLTEIVVVDTVNIKKQCFTSIARNLHTLKAKSLRETERRLQIVRHNPDHIANKINVVINVGHQSPRTTMTSGYDWGYTGPKPPSEICCRKTVHGQRPPRTSYWLQNGHSYKQ